MPEYGINSTTLNLEHLVLKANNKADWSENYVLLAGELGIELDTKKYKMGDGTTQWKDLDYYTNPAADAIVSSLTSRVDTAESTIASHGSRLDALDGTNGKIADLERADSSMGSRLDALDGTNGKIAALESKDSAQDDRLTALEAITTISANPFRS